LPAVQLSRVSQPVHREPEVAATCSVLRSYTGSGI
jgi:hypothetical protein